MIIMFISSIIIIISSSSSLSHSRHDSCDTTTFDTHSQMGTHSRHDRQMRCSYRDTGLRTHACTLHMHSNLQMPCHFPVVAQAILAQGNRGQSVLPLSLSPGWATLMTIVVIDHKHRTWTYLGQHERERERERERARDSQ